MHYCIPVSRTLNPNKFATVSSRNQTMSTFWQRTMENAKMKAFTPWVSNLYRYRNRVRESANISNQFICLGTYFSLFSPSPFSAVKCSNVHTHTHTHTHTQAHYSSRSVKLSVTNLTFWNPMYLWFLALSVKPLLSLAAAAVAKPLQLCPTLCNPIDSSPPGSPVPGILQPRTLEWVAISFSNAGKWKVKVKSLSRVWLLATPSTAAYQAPPSMGFSRQEYWSRVPLPSLFYPLAMCNFSLFWPFQSPHYWPYFVNIFCLL